MKRPVFLIAGEGKTPAELKAEARAAVEVFARAAGAAAPRCHADVTARPELSETEWD